MQITSIAIAVVANSTRQPTVPVTTPPAAGPAIAPRPTTPSCKPSIFARSPASKLPTRIAIAVPWVMAEPTPTNTRAPIRPAMLAERLASSAPIAKINAPMT